MFSSRAMSHALRAGLARSSRSTFVASMHIPTLQHPISRGFSVSTISNAIPPTVPGASPASFKAKSLSDGEYHELSDEYLDNVCTKYEDVQDLREDVDVEFSSGVLTISLARIGTYVINKQPPNKQIWLSSPLSGPKRYDYVENDAGGDWIYLRDGSSLSALLAEETGVHVHS